MEIGHDNRFSAKSTHQFSAKLVCTHLVKMSSEASLLPEYLCETEMFERPAPVLTLSQTSPGFYVSAVQVF